MSTPRIAIVAGAGESSEFSALWAVDIAEALKLDFPLIEIVGFDEQVLERLRAFSPDVVVFSRPLGMGANTDGVLTNLDEMQIPYVGTSSTTLEATQHSRIMAKLLRLAGMPITEDFYVAHGDDVAELLAYQSTTAPTEREFSFAVLDDPFPRALSVVEIDYIKSNRDDEPRMFIACDAYETYVCPAPLDEALLLRAKEIAVSMHQLCGCKGLSRTEMVLCNQNLAVRALHIRPIMSKGSLLFRAATESGYAYADLLWLLVSHAAAYQHGVIDIKSDQSGLEGALSNFHPYPFVLDNTPCASMEGLLQSLKCTVQDDQRRICGLAGVAAKEEGTQYNADWQSTQTLYWQGLAMDRHGEAYQQYIDRVYRALFDQNNALQLALRESGQRILRHKLGSKDPSSTVLTEREFTRRLYALRNH